jgi:hypothetical protein
MFVLVCSISVADARIEFLLTNLEPRASHRTVIEKTIVVPTYVLRHWKAVKLAVIDKTRGTENIYIVPIGSTLRIHPSALSISVKSFLPAFTMEGTTITSSSNELLNPAVLLQISENGDPVFQGWLFSNFPNTHAVSHPKYGFSLIGVVPLRR